MWMFLLGVYVTVAVLAFLVIGFFVCLGGRVDDLWKPFVYAPLWPLVVLFIWWDRPN